MLEQTTAAELIRAANRMHHLTSDEIRGYLHGSIATIRDMRMAVGIPGSGTERDTVINLFETATRADMLSEDALRAALLEAADMIRTLHIVADSGVTLRLVCEEPVGNANM